MNITRCNPAHLESWYCRGECRATALPIEK
jgi:hypothetical protein